jgi:hypothetical protein
MQIKVNVARLGRRVLAAFVLVGLFAVAGRNVQGQSTAYTFTRISAAGPGQNITGPAINNLGNVAFRRTCNEVFIGDGVVLSSLSTPSPCGVTVVSMSEATVAAIKSAWDQQANRFSDQILFASPGQPLTVMVDQVTTGLAALQNEWSINESGTLAFGAGSAVFVRPNGDPAAPLVAVAGAGSTSSVGVLTAAMSPALNNVGGLAFRGTVSGVGGSAVFFQGFGPFITVPGNGWVTGRLSLNDKNQLAFNDGRIVVADLGPVPQPPLRIIAVPNSINPASPFSALEQASINGHGSVAFSAVVASDNLRGIFTGPDAVLDKVVKVNDQLPGGYVVQSLEFSSEGINDRGQIVFSIASNLGPAVFRADPVVPQP